MKNSVFSLLTALLLVGAAFTAQAQAPKNISVAEANEVMQKVVGNWEVDYSIWQLKNQSFINSEGVASCKQQDKAQFMREQYSITKPDGTLEAGEGILMYSEENKRFELVQIDNTGKCSLLLIGQWYPENNTLIFQPAKGLEQLGCMDGNPMQLRYTFLEDGSFVKAIRTPDTRGNLILRSQYHYKATNDSLTGLLTN